MVIIGAGEAGVRAAFALREKGYQGPLTLLSEEKTLPYERPPLSKTVPAGSDHIRPIMPRHAYADAGIDLRLGVSVTAIDPAARALHLTGGGLGYDKLLLTTGAEARRLPGFQDALYLRRDSDAAAIMSRLGPDMRLVILGAGFIGLELAATARAMGAEVTVVEMAPRILGRAVLPDLAQMLHDRHVAEGVRIVTGHQAAAHPAGVLLETGEDIPADLLVVGIGSVPRTDLAEAAGLLIDNGIVVDQGFQTSAPDIYAAGDCCAIRRAADTIRFESWRIAREQGECAAAAMLSHDPMPHPLPYFWSDQYDLCLQVAGLPDPLRPFITRDAGNGAPLHFQMDEAGRIASVSALGVGTSLSREFKLAERLIQRGSAPDPASLTDPGISLKKL